MGCVPGGKVGNYLFKEKKNCRTGCTEWKKAAWEMMFLRLCVYIVELVYVYKALLCIFYPICKENMELLMLCILISGTFLVN